jgi:signal transduction histidine kinase
MPASLRSRLILAAVLWTVGFSALVAIFWTLAPFFYPGWPGVLHGSILAHIHVWIVATVACVVVGFLLVRRALASLDPLRARLSDVRAGRERTLSGVYPSEVQPLVEDLNALLEHREQTIQRALAKAGDLAHGLKTPLAVMSQEAERADTGAGAPDGLAATVLEQVERMRRQIESHLTQARAAATGARPGARCLVRESVDGLVRTLSRLHAGKGMTIRVDVPPGCADRGGREELDEMLGNLLDNACQWAKTLVAVTAADDHGRRVVVTVDDDGPGLPPAMWDTVLQRGIRADETAPGSGLGLAIVRDLAELAGGSIRLSQSPLGGLRATLELPGG